MLITQLESDKIVIRGPSVDGGYAITFYVGEYMQDNVAGLLKIPQQTPITLMIHAENTVKVKVEDE